MSGHLITLIGASGSGKDSLLSYARHRLAGTDRVIFAHRYITRPFDAGGENHVALSEAEFDARLAKGVFALHWAGNGQRYGIGGEIDLWLAKGLTVVMNGSRAHLPEARRRYPDLRAVLVSVDPDTLAQRLRARGREDEEAIARRVARAGTYAALPDIQHRLANNRTLAEAGEDLVRIILAYREETPPCA